MAGTINGTVTATTWIDLSGTHSLVSNQEYVISNTGDSDIEMREVATLPAVADEGHPVPAGDTWSFTQDDTLEMYIIARGGTTRYTITEAS